jgi:hypothetical protein
MRPGMKRCSVKCGPNPPSSVGSNWSVDGEQANRVGSGQHQQHCAAPPQARQGSPDTPHVVSVGDRSSRTSRMSLPGSRRWPSWMS